MCPPFFPFTYCLLLVWPCTCLFACGYVLQWTDTLGNLLCSIWLMIRFRQKEYTPFTERLNWIIFNWLRGDTLRRWCLHVSVSSWGLAPGLHIRFPWTSLPRLVSQVPWLIKCSSPDPWPDLHPFYGCLWLLWSNQEESGHPWYWMTMTHCS